MSTTFQNNPRFSMGSLRAFARDVPEGYEQDSNWTADLAGADPTSLLRIYARREQDRLDAQNRQGLADYYAGGPDASIARQSPNMAGFAEGTQYNDAAAGIDPLTGAVIRPPTRAKVNVRALKLPNSLLALNQYARG